jgi:hypothetical protein
MRRPTSASPAPVARKRLDRRGTLTSSESENVIANANPATFAKRAREVEKKRKADDKRAKRALRKQAKAGRQDGHFG